MSDLGGLCVVASWGVKVNLTAAVCLAEVMFTSRLHIVSEFARKSRFLIHQLS